MTASYDGTFIVWSAALRDRFAGSNNRVRQIKVPKSQAIKDTEAGRMVDLICGHKAWLSPCLRCYDGGETTKRTAPGNRFII